MPKNTRRVQLILAAARKYGRTLRAFTCRFNQETAQFVYTIEVAKRHSGQRGGNTRGYHRYDLENLTPEQRDTIRKIRIEPGCANAISRD